MMLGTASVDAFMAAPTGRFLLGQSWLYWCARPALYGITLWGRPSEDGITTLTRALTIELAPGVRPHASLIDARRLEGVDAGAFTALSTYVETHHAALSEQVTQLALVKPGGFAGAIASGFYEVLDAPYPVRLFDGTAEACRWLTGSPEEVVRGALESAYEAVAGVPPVVAQVRTIASAGLTQVDVHHTARVLGVSERTLQRRLKAAKTTFQQELTHARIAEARRRMLDSDAPLTQIALDVGFGSLQHFSGHFSRLVGCSPSTWRSTNQESP